MNLYEEYEQERKSTLSEAEAFERSAMDCGDWDLASTCETTKVILEDIRILVVEASEQKKDDNWQAKIRKKSKDIKETGNVDSTTEDFANSAEVVTLATLN